MMMSNPIVLLLLLVIIATCKGCTTNMDCSLGGECVNQKCECDQTWTGPTCAKLNLLPANRSEGLHQDGYASWGGNVVEEAGKASSVQ